MIRTDLLAFFSGGGNQSSSGQMIGLAEEASRPLMDGGDGLFGKDGVIHPCEAEVMVEVIIHALAVDGFQMASSDYPGREG